MSADLELVVVIDAENPIIGDLKLTNGQMTFIFDDDAVVQHVRTRLGFFLGEWFLDLREGIPYYRDVFIKNPSREVLESIFSQVILDTPGVELLRSIELDLNKSTRKMDIAFEMVLSSGKVVSSDFGEFIIGVI